mmetsp:Transcript_53781/g.156819  ORF Transcript_53781/g.156819 Transcript_53781/m.156819 type:complete len:205 (+) Transcript_53781:61-675(+)
MAEDLKENQAGKSGTWALQVTRSHARCLSDSVRLLGSLSKWSQVRHNERGCNAGQGRCNCSACAGSLGLADVLAAHGQQDAQQGQAPARRCRRLDEPQGLPAPCVGRRPRQQQQELGGVERQEVRQLHRRLPVDLVAGAAGRARRDLEAPGRLLGPPAAPAVAVGHLHEADGCGEAQHGEAMPEGAGPLGREARGPAQDAGGHS